MLLKLGMSGPAVATLVEDLTNLGFAPDGVTGTVFNAAVDKAVRAFQSRHLGPDGLPLVIDGQVGPLTRFALDVRLDKRQPAPPLTMPVPEITDRPDDASVAGWNALQIAMDELAKGAGEVGGNNKGPHVMRYHAVTGAASGDPWCASFVSFCFHSGNPGAMPYTPTAGARATLNAFKKNDWTYQASLTNPPQAGDIIVWWRNSLSSYEGHIGIVSGYADGIVHTIEGNRTPKVAAFHYKLGTIDKLLGFGRAVP